MMAGSRYRVVSASPTRRTPDGIDDGGAATGVDPFAPELDDPLPVLAVSGRALSVDPEPKLDPVPLEKFDDPVSLE